METPTRSIYIRDLQAWLDTALSSYEKDTAEWLDSTSGHFWGFNPPGHPISVAQVEAFLAVEEDDDEMASRAAERLATYGQFREQFPMDRVGDRAEYKDGVPRCPSFFVLPRFCETYLDIRDRGVVTSEQHSNIQEIIAESADGVLPFAEWGAHNRTTLRAWALAASATAVPDHPQADVWRQMSRQLADDSVGRWSVEDAMLYHSVWTRSLIAYWEVTGERRAIRSAMTRYYFDYYLNLICPIGGLADFGDSDWASLSHLFHPCFEWGANQYRDPNLRWAASELYGRLREADEPVQPESLIHAIRWMDDSVVAEEPDWTSTEVMEELVGKKVVFRSGWDQEATFCLLNYKPETDYGSTIREYMKHTISVHSEKAHHGHADENAICALTHNGSLLLHDGGYRDGLVNDDGAYRADYYHNRVMVREGYAREGQPMFPFLKTNGQYRPTETKRIDFRSFKEVDFSRTRVMDRRAGWSHDRIVAWLKRPNVFAVIDAVSFLEEAPFTLSSVYYTHNVLTRGEGWFDTQIGEMQAYTPSHADTSLLVMFPKQPNCWEGEESVNRYYTDETMLYQGTSGLGRPGTTQVMYSLLAPKATDADPKAIAESVQIAEVSRPGKAAALRLEVEGETITVGAKLDLADAVLWEDIRPRRTWDSGRTVYGDLETDAHFVYAREAGERLSYAWTEATRFDFKDQTVFQAPVASYPLQYAGPDTRDGVNEWRAWEDEVTIDERS